LFELRAACGRLFPFVRLAFAMSQFGTFVWTGRALQAGFEQMEGGLALLYPALAWSD